MCILLLLSRCPTYKPSSRLNSPRDNTIMAWIIAVILLLLLIWQASATKRLAQKLNSLNEYTQFLLFYPNVYTDHRSKFGDFLKSIKGKDASDQAMLSYQVIEEMAIQGEGTFLLANAIKRANPEDI